MLSDIMAESSSPSTTNNHQSQAEIEDEIAVYDDFLKVHKKPAEVETAEDLPDFVIPQMNNVPSQSQLSALSDATPPTSGKGQPPASNSTSPTPQFPTALGTTVEQPEEEDYSEDEEEEEEGVFLRIGRMTLSETQAKLYGLKKDPKKPKFVVPTYKAAAERSKRSRLSAAKMEKISKPVRKFNSRTPQTFALESEKTNCTFKPSKSKAAVAAMKSNDCGYDFLDNLEKEGEGFIKRMDAFENYRRSKFQRDQEEQYYNHCVDKKQCPNCGQLQTYDEWRDKRMICNADRCSHDSFKYCIPNAFMMERFERRMEKSTTNREKVVMLLKKEYNTRVVAEKTQIQKDLMAKVSSSGKTFIRRMYTDIEAKSEKLKTAQSQDFEKFNSECTFKPSLNVDKKWLKNRDPNLLYAAPSRVEKAKSGTKNKSKKKVNGFTIAAQKKARKPASAPAPAPAAGRENRLGPKRRGDDGEVDAGEEQKIKANFEKLLM